MFFAQNHWFAESMATLRALKIKSFLSEQRIIFTKQRQRNNEISIQKERQQTRQYKKTETTQTADIIIKQKEPLYQNNDKATPLASYPPKGGTAKIKKQNNPKT